MVHGKSVVMTAGLWLIASALFFSDSLIAEIRPGSRMAPERAIELRTRAAEMEARSRTSPEIRERIIRENPALKSYIEGKTKLGELKAPELEAIGRLHSAEAGSSISAMKALTTALDPAASKSVAAEIAKSVEGQVKGNAGTYVQGIMARRANIATELSEPAKHGLTAERVAALYQTGGSIDRLLTASYAEPQNAAAIRGNNFKQLMAVERHASEVAAKGGEENVRLAESIREAARLGARDKEMLGEMTKIVEEARNNPRGESALALEGVDVVGKGVEYAKTNTQESADLYAKTIAGKDGDVNVVKAEIAANEAKLIDATLKEVGAKSGIDVAGVKTMGELVAKLDEAIARETNATKKALLEEMRDEVMAKRLMAAIEASPRFKAMSANEKVRLMQCMLRAGGMRSMGAKVGAVTALSLLAGISNTAFGNVLDGKDVVDAKGKPCEGAQCQALATKTTIPEKLFSGEESGNASAGRSTLGGVASKPAKAGAETHKK